MIAGSRREPLKSTPFPLALAALFVAILMSPTPVAAQEIWTGVSTEELMDSDIDTQRGSLRLDRLTLAFPPAGRVATEVGVIDGNGKLIGHFPATEDEAARREGFTVLQARNAGVRLGKAGVYSVVFRLGGEPVSRFSFLVKESGAASGSFTPEERYSVDGPWRTLAHITRREIDGAQVPVLTTWLGGRDLPRTAEGEGRFMANLYRGGRLVAHSKWDTGLYFEGPYQRREAILFHPHDPYDAPSARLFTMSDLLTDGGYEIRVQRVPDRTSMRRFRFSVAGGAIRQLPKAQENYEPAMDRILPWVRRASPDGEALVEAFWIGVK